VKGYEVGEECSMHGRDQKFRRTAGKYHLGGICIHKLIILKWVLKTQYGKNPVFVS
jgi:hypothetical protein